MHPEVVLHIPHASTLIPPELRRIFPLEDGELAREVRVLTDHFTDELYHLEGAGRVVFPVSRLLVDPERFRDDHEEPMAARGMGAVYRLTHDGRPLKTVEAREPLLAEYYDPHHRRLEVAVERALAECGRCLIVDCHSYPAEPLPSDLDQTPGRPDFCLGTDGFHTPPALAQTGVEFLQKAGYSCWVDRPYAGTIVPLRHLRKDARVASIMVEVNRRLYMDEVSGERSGRFDKAKCLVERLIGALAGVGRTE